MELKVKEIWGMGEDGCEGYKGDETGVGRESLQTVGLIPVKE